MIKILNCQHYSNCINAVIIRIDFNGPSLELFEYIASTVNTTSALLKTGRL